MKINIRIFSGRRNQRGISTLAITMMLLLILSVVVLFSTSVGFFEQRTALNENRARIAEQAAEAGINMAGEYVKASRTLLISNQVNAAGPDGWLAETAEAGWRECSKVVVATIDGRPHPCRSEADTTRRAQLWYYQRANGSTYLPFGVVGDVGGNAKFASVVNVQAVLCRIDSSLSTPSCAKKPDKGNRVAITFISHATLPDEGGASTIKETWASYSDSNPSTSVPLIGSGYVKGLGNAQIVANPNAGGYGVPVSIWSPNDVGVGSVPGGACEADKGVGSVVTCQVGEYLKNTPASELKTTCADEANACECPAVSSSENNFLSGHSGSVKKEGIDILDIDNNDGILPDAGYFPGVDCNKKPLDDLADDSDDSLFEFVFNVSNVVKRGEVDTLNDCNGGDCAVFHLIENLGANDTLIDCDGLNETSSGLYYISGPCNGMPPQVGSPESPVVVVVEDGVFLNGQTNFYGLLFIRSKNQSAYMKGTGGAKIFGSLVVEGDIELTGSLHIVYDNTAISSDPNILPSNVKFARVPGSWLDATEGF